MVEDEDDIIVESSKNLLKITEDGSDMIYCEDDDAISILDEGDAEWNKWTRNIFWMFGWSF